MGLMMLLVWLPLLVVLVWALRQFAIPRQPPPEPPSSAPSAEPDAREIARRAYARGEMERERFLEVMRDLDETAPPGDASR
jgi:uncharacterized membrane protein